MTQLKPCPSCKKTSYEYGFDVARLVMETAIAYVEIKFAGAFGKFLRQKGAGMGILSLPVLAYQGIFLGLDGNPVLHCRHCDFFVLPCRNCEKYMLLERYPKTAELIECPFCQAHSQTCESNDNFDKLLRYRTNG